VADARGVVSQVHEGRNGRLFLGSQDGFDLSRFAKGEVFNEPMLETWRRTISRRAQDLAARGVPYIFLIVPDTPSIYPEDLPGEIGDEVTPPGQVFMDAIGDIEGVTFVYPLKALREAKGGLEIYKKKDSHWTTFGSYVGYQALMQGIGKNAACRRLDATDLQFGFRQSYGDLGSAIQPEQSEDVPIPKIGGPAAAVTLQMDGVARQTATESCLEGLGEQCRALFFRDSFMTDLAPYVARSFSHVLTIGSTTRLMLDAVDHWGADIVVSEVAERKLGFIESDHQLEGYATMFGANYRTSDGKLLLQARLMLSHDPAGALLLIEDRKETYKRNHGQAFSAAIIYESNGRSEEANELAQAALSQEPEQAPYAALAARTALACGRSQEATNLSQSAARLAPYNGYFHELYAYCLICQTEAAQALRVVEDALLIIDDHPNLYYWSSLLHLGSGDVYTARARNLEAISLAPENAVYEEQRRQIAEAK
jgi:Flp pilus assembly protein TadD